MEYLIVMKHKKFIQKYNLEYPIRSDIALNKFMSDYLIPVKDNLNLNKIGLLNKEAFLMMGESGWQ